MPTPFPHQITGAVFLANRNAALLADEQRVGKTGSAITACDMVLAHKILIVTTATARAQWGYDFREWSGPHRKIQVVYSASDRIAPDADVVVVGWVMASKHGLLKQFTARRWDVLILDESHYAKTPGAARTQAAYGTAELPGLRRCAARVWCLSGTPIANAPNDLWTMLHALDPERIDGMSYNAFMHRYCVVKKKYVGGQWIEYAIKGRNEDELRERLKGFWLRRTQADVGIKPPIFSVFPLHIEAAPAELRDITPERAVAILDMFDAEEVDSGFATLRRVTGVAKAHGVVDAVKEALDNGLDKVVLMHWHTEVGEILRNGLYSYGVVGIDGSTPATKRQAHVEAFQSGGARVFVGQIIAAGEAIDLSSACELWFVEPSIVPKDMAQAAMRITNHSQKRQALVRVCAAANTIDEQSMEILTRKVKTIKQIMEK